MALATPAGLALLTAAAVTAAGCGGPRSVPATVRQVDGVRYEVRAAHLLSPQDRREQPLFVGVVTSACAPAQGTWLGVFVRARNVADEPRRTAGSVVLVDGHLRPVPAAPHRGANPYAYRALRLPPGGVLPAPGSPADLSPEQGALLLFCLPRSAAHQRLPLAVRIGGRGAGLIRLAGRARPAAG